MIDFRYHLVSLISVFLALAVGIILGAGPLQGAIGEQLTEQVDTLRVERNDLRDALSAAEADRARQLQFIEASGPALVEGVLDGVAVAIVDLDGVTTEAEQSITEAIEAAGGTVATTVALSPGWTDEDHEGLRETIASGIQERLATLVPDLAQDASADQRLAAALGVALSDKDQFGARSKDAEELERQLTQADLLAVTTEFSTPVDAVLLLSTAAADDGTGDAESDRPGKESLVTLARTVQELTPTVAAGPTTTAGDVVAAVRADGDAAETVSTVSGTETAVGRIVVPLALASHLRGEVGHFGFEDGATAIPSVVRPSPEETTAPDDEAGDPGAGDPAVDGAQDPDGEG